MLVKNAAWWWCTRDNLFPPDEDSDLYVTKSQEALHYLLERIPNSDGHSVLQYAISLGGIEVLDRIYNIENVYRFTDRDQIRFDVTNMTPQTLEVPAKDVSGSAVFSTAQKRTFKASFGQASVAPSDYSYSGKSTVAEGGVEKESASSLRQTVLAESGLEIVVSMADEVTATRVLDVLPINFLIIDYWTIYRFIYLTLMVIHLVHMGLFSGISIPKAAQRWNHTKDTLSDFDTDPAYGCLLIWPCLILLYSCIYLLSQMIGYWSRDKMDRKPLFKERPKELFDTLFVVFDWLMSYISMITAVAFGVLSIVWYVTYSWKARAQVYYLAVVLILGWLYSIHFTKGFQTVHAFSIMLKYIIIRDISRFLFIYSFVLLGFAFAMHALFQISEPMRESYPTGGHSLFTTFNMMIGMDEIFDEDSDENYSSVGSSSVYLRVAYLFYIILSTIVLLNLLIAMMSDTYNDIKSREGTTWRVGSLSMALRIELSLPLLGRGLRMLRNWSASFPVEQQQSRDGKVRYYLTLARGKIQTGSGAADSETKQALTKLESRLNLMNNDFAEMSRHLEEMLTLVTSRRHGDDDRPASARPVVRPSTAAVKSKLSRKLTPH